MHIRSLTLNGFMRHTGTDLRLPDKGVVLVTGVNGGGKSSLLESVAFAVFGKTLRGTQPWPETGGSLRVMTDTVDITCTKKGSGSAKVAWHAHDGNSVNYDTPTKARAALATMVGAFDTWRRTSVFSASDAAHYSLATDSERKLLIERLLGHDRFDEALKACRADAKANGVALQSLQLRQAAAKERVRGLQARIEDAHQVSVTQTASLVPQARINAASAEIAAMKAQERELGQAAQAEQKAVAEAEADVRTAARELSALNHDNCPTCGSAIEEDRKCTLRGAVDQANRRAKAARVAIEANSRARQAELHELQEELASLRQIVASADAAKRAYDANAAAIAAHTAKLSSLNADLVKAMTEGLGAEEKIAVLQAEAAELDSVESVLGLRGVRAHLLGKALRALTGLANARLATLFPGVTVLIAESNDRLVMEVKGLPHAEGYEGCSSGERRRVDIAVLFALGDLEALSRGAKAGTLFLDEVADTLDTEGVDAVATLLADLAKERAVVLITHNKDLVARLSTVAVLRAHVSEGAVSCY